MLKIDTEGTKVDLESRIQEHFNAKDLTQDEVREILSRVGDATIVPTTPGRKQQMRAIPSLMYVSRQTSISKLYRSTTIGRVLTDQLLLMDTLVYVNFLLLRIRSYTA